MNRRRKIMGVLGALSLAAAAFAPAATASDVTLVRTGIGHDMLFDVAFEGTRGVAVGTFGSVLTSENGGEWRPIGALANKLALLGTAIAAGRCLAVGQAGAVLVADDCRSWQTAASGTNARLMAVALNRHGVAYAVGAFGTILQSTDGGHRWSAVKLDWPTVNPSGSEPHLYGVHVDDDGGVVVVGEFGVVLRSRNGASWQVTHRGEQSLFGLSMVGKKGYAVGQGGIVLASEDRGASWRTLVSNTRAILTGVWNDGNGHIVIAGLNTVLQSRDGGASWGRVDAGAYSQSAHTAVAASELPDGKRRVLVVGAAARVLELKP